MSTATTVVSVSGGFTLNQTSAPFIGGTVSINTNAALGTGTFTLTGGQLAANPAGGSGNFNISGFADGSLEGARFSGVDEVTDGVTESATGGSFFLVYGTGGDDSILYFEGGANEGNVQINDLGNRIAMAAVCSRAAGDASGRLHERRDGYAGARSG